jgi:hypothetical protein
LEGPAEDEEYDADRALTELAESKLNREAA